MVVNEKPLTGSTPSGQAVSLCKERQKWPEGLLQAERLASIINSAMDGVIIIDESQRIVLFNPAAEAIFLCSAAEAIGEPIDRFIPDLFQSIYHDQISKFGVAESPRRAAGAATEIRGLRANGDEFSIEASISQIESGGQKLDTIILRDITERKQMEEELRYLSGRLISVRDAERRRIARELHDDLTQRIAMLSIDLDQLNQEIPKQLPGVRARVKDLRVQAYEIALEIRHLSYRLHSSRIEHLGLVAALKGLCCDLSKHHGLKIEFRPGNCSAALPKEITLCIFRIAQELIHNIIKHSGAREALIVLENTGQSLGLAVSDEGRGFDEESAMAKGGLGLISIRERLRLVGGKILVQTQPARGTRIDVTVPLTRQPERDPVSQE